MTPFKNIGLVGRPGHDGVVDSLERILDYLARRGLTSVLDFKLPGLLITAAIVTAMVMRSQIGQTS